MGSLLSRRQVIRRYDKQALTDLIWRINDLQVATSFGLTDPHPGIPFTGEIFPRGAKHIFDLYFGNAMSVNVR
jgi:hypothetical protein